MLVSSAGLLAAAGSIAPETPIWLLAGELALIGTGFGLFITPNSTAIMFCDIGLVVDPRTGRLIVVSAIDNLCRGASGQAVACANLMSGLPVDAGLHLAPLMLAFTPLFLLVTSPLTLGEFPSPAGVGGLMCVALGSYVLNLRERRKGFWGPVRALWTNRSARLMGETSCGGRAAGWGRRARPG